MKNEAAGFTALFREHFVGVTSAVQRFGVHPRNAKDVAQDVFLNVLNALDRYDPSRPFKSWLKTITYRTARDHLELRRTGERLTPTGQIERMESAANPEQRLFAKRAEEALRDVLQDLDADDRAVFLMSEIDEHTQPEIARSLGIPETTVQSRLRRAREEFEKAALRRRKIEESRPRGGRGARPLR
jgi:RNA polymerase sigma-70 factor, ECF subfamily